MCIRPPCEVRGPNGEHCGLWRGHKGESYLWDKHTWEKRQDAAKRAPRPPSQVRTRMPAIVAKVEFDHQTYRLGFELTGEQNRDYALAVALANTVRHELVSKALGFDLSTQEGRNSYSEACKARRP